MSTDYDQMPLKSFKSITTLPSRGPKHWSKYPIECFSVLEAFRLQGRVVLGPMTKRQAQTFRNILFRFKNALWADYRNLDDPMARIHYELMNTSTTSLDPLDASNPASTYTFTLQQSPLAMFVGPGKQIDIAKIQQEHLANAQRPNEATPDAAD